MGAVSVDAALAAFRTYFNPEREPGDRRVDAKAIDPIREARPAT